MYISLISEMGLSSKKRYLRTSINEKKKEARKLNALLIWCITFDLIPYNTNRPQNHTCTVQEF